MFAMLSCMVDQDDVEIQLTYQQQYYELAAKQANGIQLMNVHLKKIIGQTPRFKGLLKVY